MNNTKDKRKEYTSGFNLMRMLNSCNNKKENKPKRVETLPMPTIKILYHDKEMPKLDFIGGSEKSNWIDLYTAEDVTLKKGEFTLISLGISAEIPKGTEVRIAPRSSSYKNFKILFTNAIGVIDTSYCGNDDIWKSPILAMEDTFIPKYSRICQFRLYKTMNADFPLLRLEEVNKLDGENRGGFGTTGK